MDTVILCTWLIQLAFIQKLYFKTMNICAVNYHFLSNILQITNANRQ